MELAERKLWLIVVVDGTYDAVGRSVNKQSRNKNLKLR